MRRAASIAMADTLEDPNVRANLRWGYLNRTFAEIGKALADPTIVLSLFVRQLGASNVLVGLLSTIRYGGWFLPQIFVAAHVQNRSRRGAVYIAAELSRCVGYAIIALLIFTIPGSPWLLPTFFVLFGISYLGHGMGSVPRFDVIGRAVPATRRGSYFARANLLAGVCGFGAGFLIRAVLRTNAPSPHVQPFAWLLLLSILFFGLAVGAFTLIREREPRVAAQRTPVRQSLGAIPSLLRGNVDYRRLVMALVFSDASRRVTDPFYIIFATEVLGAPLYVAGIYISTLLVSKIAANLLWDLLSRRFGNRLVLQISTAASFAVPAVALAFALMRLASVPWTAYGFAGVYVLMGIRDSGKYVGKRAVFLDLIPEEGRPMHWGTLNTLLGVVSVLPVLAGTLIDSLGYVITFSAVSAVSLVAVWSSLRIRKIPSSPT
ncbi:MAG: hypothetical protein JSW65_04730 [Candidatus Bipolaricaulota bacterium]|nr:MAG: hypothetical protein JSW65_04730 [Candidatus Bipolaricaulota bacterium]